MLKIINLILLKITLFTGLYTQKPFVTTWDSNISGVTSESQILIPGYGNNYLVEWEEVDNPMNNGSLTGNDETLVTFPSAGTYQISISGEFAQIRFNNEGDRLKLLSIDQWGDIVWECMAEAFYGCSNLEYNATDIPNLANVKSLSAMFKYCSRFNGYINEWDVSNVVDMSQMFYAAIRYNQRMTLWDVSNVETMEEMFLLARDFRAGIRTWNTGNVRNMSRMFRDARRFNNDIGDWDVSNVENFERMFKRATSFNKNINSWELSSAKNMSHMFLNAESFNQPLDNWRFPNIEHRGIDGLFRGASAFNQNIESWDVSNVSSFHRVFQEAVSFNQPLDNWDVSNAEDMSFMFWQAESFNQLLSNWDVSNVKGFESMFAYTTNFNQPLDNWDVSNATGMLGMFLDATNFNQSLNSWDVSNVTNMGLMFANAINFNQPLNSWDVSNVEFIFEMFNTATSFNQPLNNWNVTNAIFLNGMFENAFSFDQNLGSWKLNKEISIVDRIFNHSGMSCKNYDLTLIGWSENPDTPDNRVLGAEGIYYWQSEEARTKLINDKGWTIVGDSFKECNYLDCEAPESRVKIVSEYPVCIGDAVRLTSVKAGPEYQWYKDGDLLTGESERELMVTVPGAYAVSYTDEEGCESELSKALEIEMLDVGLSMTNARDTVLRSIIPNCEGKAVFDAALLGCDLDLTATEAHSLWRLDIHNTGSFDRFSTEARPDGSPRENLRIEEELPFGTHRVQWEIRDQHENVVIEEHLLTLVDMNPPTPVCLHGIAASIHPSSGQITLPAWVYDVGSWDDCTDSEDLIFTYSSDLSHTHHSWNCDDLDGERERTIEIEIWVTNKYGHQNHCATYIKVQDNRDVCPASSSSPRMANEDPLFIAPAILQLQNFSEDRKEVIVSRAFTLHPNRPNPFSNSTTIDFELPESGSVNLSIYNPYGARLYHRSRIFPEGTNEWQIDAGDLPHTGFYIYRLNFNGKQRVGTMVRVE